VAKKVSGMNNLPVIDKKRVESWINRYCRTKAILLSDERASAVKGIVCEQFSILTGGPGCGKTTTTLVIVKLLEAMKLTANLSEGSVQYRPGPDGGCRFVIWEMVSGKKLTPANIRTLTAGKSTRKYVFKTQRGGKFRAKLKLEKNLSESWETVMLERENY
jgi:hypothetical protein